MLQFKTDEEAIAWGKTQAAGKYHYTNIKVGDEDVILCQTNLVYEDDIWNHMYNAMKFMTDLLPDEGKNTEDECVDDASELRDKCLELFEKGFNVRILCVFDEI